MVNFWRRGPSYKFEGIIEAWRESVLRLRLIDRREQLGWSKGDVSRKSGFTRASISQWENARRVPSRFALMVWIDTVGLERKDAA